MAQYQNEYEGMGNALMNIGSMYYADSARKKEEARKRKELEDERKYQEAQADKAYARQAPLELLKQKLAEARIASAEADKVRTETQTYMPKTQMLGNIARTTMPVRDANGNLSYESTDETMQPLNPYNQRPAAAPRPVSMDGPQGPGMYIPDGAGGYTKIGNPIPKAQSSTGGLTTAQYLSNLGRIESDRQKVKTMSQFDINQSGSTREAMLKDLATREEQLNKYYTPPTGPLMNQGGTTEATPEVTAADMTPKEAKAFAAYAAGNTGVGDALLAGANGGKVNVNLVPQQEAAPEVKVPPAAAIAALRANHDLAEQFDAKFGKGSAAKYLKGK